MTDSDKKEFIELEEQDRKRFEREMAEYNKTGYFTDKNGINSKTFDKVKEKISKKQEQRDEARQSEFRKSGIALKKTNTDNPNIPKKASVAFMFFVKDKSEFAKTKLP